MRSTTAKENTMKDYLRITYKGSAPVSVVRPRIQEPTNEPIEVLDWDDVFVTVRIRGNVFRGGHTETHEITYDTSEINWARQALADVFTLSSTKGRDVFGWATF
jgi:hypothetical protein